MPSRARAVYFLGSILSLGSVLTLFRNASSILKANGNIHELCKIRPDVLTHLLIIINIFSNVLPKTVLGKQIVLGSAFPGSNNSSKVYTKERKKNLLPGTVYQNFQILF